METQAQSLSEKKPMKERLASKWVDANFSESLSPMPPLRASLQAAYLAGFERAKALCIDHVARSVDPRIESKDYEPPYKAVSLGRLPSEVLALLGEDV